MDGHFTEVEVLQELSNILSEISINESVRMHEDTNIGVNGGENEYQGPVTRSRGPVAEYEWVMKQGM